MNIQSTNGVSTLIPDSTPAARKDAPAPAAQETAPASAPAETGGAQAVGAAVATQTDAPPRREPRPAVADEPSAGDRPSPGSAPALSSGEPGERLVSASDRTSASR